MKCKHPDHIDSENCYERAVGCNKLCECCMGKNFVRTNKKIKLILIRIYKDGGSETYKDKENNLYWRCLKVVSEKSKYKRILELYNGKIFHGSINKFPHCILARGTFILPNNETIIQ